MKPIVEYEKLPPFVCLCPTYGRPKEMIEDTIASFLWQTYPKKYLLILDDLGNLPESSSFVEVKKHSFVEVKIISTTERFPSLPEKYNWMLNELPFLFGFQSNETILCAVWDDDDLYLPNYLMTHATQLVGDCFGFGSMFVWSHPTKVLSTYRRKGFAVEESVIGRFHGSLAFLLREDVRWPRTKRADFDQQFISSFQRFIKGDPCAYFDPQYIFRWSDSGASHCQSLMISPSNEDWYDRNLKTIEQVGGVIDALAPRFNSSSLTIYGNLGIQAPAINPGE